MEKKDSLSPRRRWALGILTLGTLLLAGVCYAYPLPPAGYAGVVEYYAYVLDPNTGPEEQVTGWRVYSACAQGGPISWGAQSRNYRIVYIPCN